MRRRPRPAGERGSHREVSLGAPATTGVTLHATRKPAPPSLSVENGYEIPFVCVAFMTLYEEGWFQLLDPVARFLPTFGAVRVPTGTAPSDTREGDQGWTQQITVRLDDDVLDGSA